MNIALGSHLMGSDMSYQYLGNNKYKITIKFYRDCRGLALDAISFGAFAGKNGSNTCGNSTLTTPTLVSIKDISPKCSTSVSPCTPANTYGTGKGIEEHTFVSIVDFNTSPLNGYVNNSSCCDVTFYVNQCCRNGAITTGSAGNDFYTTCSINLCNIQKTKIKYNSSPQLSNSPVGFLCCNIPWYNNYGAIDTVDFDSISYKLVDGIKNIPNDPISYTSPFSSKYPMTPFCTNGTITCIPQPNANPPKGFFFDQTNGSIITTPTKCDEVPVIVIELTEWRKDSSTGNWIAIGKTRRDMQFWVLSDCSNNYPPVINGTSDTTVIEGNKICYKIKITDETATSAVPDSVIGTWNHGIYGASFNVVDSNAREKEYEFCWQTKMGQAKDFSYMFTVTATDQHCSPPAISSKAFKIKVVTQPSSNSKNLNNFSIKLYPNPVHSAFNIQGNHKIGKIQVFDAVGNLVYSQLINQINAKINLSHLNKGSYFIKVYNQNNEEVVYKIFKE